MKKIIYKMVDGEPTSVMMSNKVPDGYQSIELNSEIRKLEDVDWESLRTKAAKDREALLKTRSTLIEKIKNNAYHVTEHPKDANKRFSADYDTWDAALDAWRDELEQTNDQIELMEEGKEYSLISITPDPVL